MTWPQAFHDVGKLLGYCAAAWVGLKYCKFFFAGE